MATLPFTPLESTILPPEQSEMLAGVPLYDIDDLLSRVGNDGLEMSFVDAGDHGVVFRVKDAKSPSLDLAVKIMIPYKSHSGIFLKRQFSESGTEGIKKYLKDNMDYVLKDDLVFRHIQGHKIGHTIESQHIDEPQGAWVRCLENGLYNVVGYSIPFIEGKPDKISLHPELMDCARELLKLHHLYVGSPGFWHNESMNVIFDKNGIGKFIDVQLLDPNNATYQEKLEQLSPAEHKPFYWPEEI